MNTKDILLGLTLVLVAGVAIYAYNKRKNSEELKPEPVSKQDENLLKQIKIEAAS